MPAKRQHLKRSYGLVPESQGQNLALTVLYVPSSFHSGQGVLGERLPRLALTVLYVP